MKISYRTIDQVKVIVVDGELDNDTAAEFLEALSQDLNKKLNLVLDLKHCVYISSAGIQAIYQIHKILNQANVQLVICHAEGNVRKVLNLVAIADDIPLFTDEKEAIEHLQSK